MYNYTFDDYLATQKVNYDRYWVDERRFKVVYDYIASFQSELLSSSSNQVLNNICEYGLKFNTLSDRQYFVIEQIANSLGLTFSNTVEIGVLCREA